MIILNEFEIKSCVSFQEGVIGSTCEGALRFSIGVYAFPSAQRVYRYLDAQSVVP